MRYDTFTTRLDDGREIVFEVPDTILAPIYAYPVQSANVDEMRRLLAA